jgi:hypothetical protein
MLKENQVSKVEYLIWRKKHDNIFYSYKEVALAHTFVLPIDHLGHFKEYPFFAHYNRLSSKLFSLV